MSLWNRHKIFEKNSIILIAGILAVIAIGGLVEIAPLFYLKSTVETVEGVRPYTPLELAGRKVDQARVQQLANTLGIGNRLDHLPRRRSFGQVGLKNRAIGSILLM